tara:strand:+ start:2798 stop:3430 length:633 start_codon:yes stop_codon:yes gene_type:complete
MTSTLFVEELKGRTTGTNANKVIVPSGQKLEAHTLSGTSTVEAGAKIAGTDTGSLSAPGMILQMAGDTYAPNTHLDITTSDTRPLGTNLQVSLTTQSTNNKLFVQVFIPDLYNNGTTTRALNGGFRYSTDSFSSSDVQLGDKETIADHESYHSGDLVLRGLNYCTFCSVPVAGAIKIQPRLQAMNGTFRIMANNTSARGVCTLIVQEIKG